MSNKDDGSKRDDAVCEQEAAQEPTLSRREFLAKTYSGAVLGLLVGASAGLTTCFPYTKGEGPAKWPCYQNLVYANCEEGETPVNQYSDGQGQANQYSNGGYSNAGPGQYSNVGGAYSNYYNGPYANTSYYDAGYSETTTYYND